MSTNKIIISILFVCISIFSCTEKKNQTKLNTTQNGIVMDTLFMKGDYKMQYGFGVPDTLLQGVTYDCKLLYKGILDTVNTKLGTRDGKTRYIIYSYIKTKSVNYDDKYLLEQVKLDTISSITNDTINLFNLRFSEPGLHYIDGIIEDEVYIDQKDNSEKVRVITKRIRATHKVYIKPNKTKEEKIIIKPYRA